MLSNSKELKKRVDDLKTAYMFYVEGFSSLFLRRTEDRYKAVAGTLFPDNLKKKDQNRVL